MPRQLDTASKNLGEVQHHKRQTYTPSNFLSSISITTKANVDYEKIVRDTCREIGFTSDSVGLDADHCKVLVNIEQQSPDIAQGVHGLGTKKPEEIGAGDQGHMFGYATDETEELMPLSHVLATKLGAKLTEVRKNGTCSWLRPDGKTQVTVEYRNEGGAMVPIRVHTVLISTQHDETVTNDQIAADLREFVIKPVIPEQYLDENTIFHLNPSGRFVIGGPHGDAGLTGRKIIIDTYGGWGAHGGGAFSGKDPTKVDRSGAYIVRQAAKSVVAAGLARRCIVQVSYAIGVPEPLSVFVDSYGTGKIPDAEILEIIKNNFDFRPGMIAIHLDLKRGSNKRYLKTAAYGHFGRDDPDFTWETVKPLKSEKTAASDIHGVLDAHRLLLVGGGRRSLLQIPNSSRFLSLLRASPAQDHHPLVTLPHHYDYPERSRNPAATRNIYDWWESIPLNPPATFDTIGMDPDYKALLMGDLAKFTKGKDFYASVGRAWKRGYLLYGPPGTGKSSLIGAMSNFTGYDVYDLELTKVQNNQNLWQLLIHIKERAIVVVDDIDCSIPIENREEDNAQVRKWRTMLVRGVSIAGGDLSQDRGSRALPGDRMPPREHEDNPRLRRGGAGPAWRGSHRRARECDREIKPVIPGSSTSISTPSEFSVFLDDSGKQLRLLPRDDRHQSGCGVDLERHILRLVPSMGSIGGRRGSLVVAAAKIREILMPKLSATMTEGKVVEWTKAEGDKVKKGDIVAVVESDKADMDVEVFYDGYLARIVVESGSSAAINELIALLAENEEDIAEARSKSIGLSSPAPAVEAPKVEFPDALPEVVAEEKSLVATPHAKKLAKQYKADLSKISGTGPHGRIVPADVEVFAGKPLTSLGMADPSPSSGKAEAPPRTDSTVPFTGMQAAVSKNMVESLSVPTFRVGCSISTTGIDALYRKIKSKGVTMSVLLAKAAALALARHPVVNASCKEGKSFCHNSNINIAVAVAIHGGLITPVLQNADKADVYTLARKWKELVDKARAKQLQPQEYTTGTFTISNLGMFGVDRFDAILPPGQGAIMAVGAAKPTVVASEGRVFSVKNQMQVNVTADHRILYGADLASFLDTFAKIVENAMELTL
ncbi:uncharacterized protein LOC9630123 [Selaginella moellendorffii]|uniref:uncharacterized protein LOC9630123 n=1 Tax=Selaginella moellendorffii TaxID=88036 RepID=UPI000D1CFC89|nr:uncharacterized protein LOC9630123 [Selaginella moellendorffii]|eukprot:XP_024535924.1 uncharacterized protein LOC9630123 [Selaginella moellendorffii]